MNWSTSVDLYCERTDPSFWSEPLNAVSNAAFLVAALAAVPIWRRAGSRDWGALFLILVTATVGIGSFLFHTLATRWSLLADVVPIAIFIYSYFFLGMRGFVGLRGRTALAVTGAYLVFGLGFEPIWMLFTGGVTLNGSVGYLPAAFAMLGVGAAIRRRTPDASRALLLAAVVFLVSLAFRTADHAVCDMLPSGVHAMWHVLNAVVLFILTRAMIVHGPSSRRAAVAS